MLIYLGPKGHAYSWEEGNDTVYLHSFSDREGYSVFGAAAEEALSTSGVQIAPAVNWFTLGDPTVEGFLRWCKEKETEKWPWEVGKKAPKRRESASKSPHVKARTLLQEVAEDYAAWHDVDPSKVDRLVEAVAALGRAGQQNAILLELKGEIMLQLGVILGPEEARRRVSSAMRKRR